MQKTGHFHEAFSGPRRAGNALTIKNPRKPTFATGTGTEFCCAALAGCYRT